MSIVSNIYYSLIAVGLIILLCAASTNSNNSLTSSMVGYSFMVVGLLILMGNLMHNLSLHKSNGGSYGASLFFTIGPFLSIIGIIIYTLYLIGIYFDRITGGNVSQGYYNFSQISFLIIIIQLVVFATGTQTPQYKNTFVLSRAISLCLYLLSVINIIVLITMYVILKYFSTDG
jgi:hypothetical protein